MSVTDEQIFVSASRTLARIGPFRATLNDVALLHLDLSDDASHYHAVRFAQSMRTGIASLLERAAERGELVECDVDALARRFRRRTTAR
ncbi:hypothetical protein SAMN05421507_12590 [Lentzea jiangxiensis]|uniref:Uncharacterized protein n=2 Tax=Lentzea jiangxiensis TaxID=641025 RepID=A0A1H0WXX2_9PSEU|nr:hypothetical protein SAMN05421507_12590 [Lentzea jiangxiensis]